MATQFAPLTPHKLKDELLTHPLMLSIGSLSLSTFMSRSIYGMIDWRPVSAVFFEVAIMRSIDLLCCAILPLHRFSSASLRTSLPSGWTTISTRSRCNCTH